MVHPIRRRRLLQSALGALLVPRAVMASADQRPLRFRVAETAGLRRFGYPVSTILPGVHATGAFQLTRGGRAVPAQFRSVVGPDGETQIALDFNASPGPLEVEDYIITRLEQNGHGLEPRDGLRLEQADRSFQVANGPSLRFTLRDDLSGFLSGVTNTHCEFVKPGSAGLRIESRDGLHDLLGTNGPDRTRPRATVERQGPIAVGLRFEGSPADLGDARVRANVKLTFPNSKSWVEARCRVDDPDGVVKGLGLDLHLEVQGGTALVDLGAGSTVYSPLRRDEQIELTADRDLSKLLGRSWSIRKGPAGRLERFAEAAGPDAPPAEGWAHVMDASCCTALAVADFGRFPRDSILVEADGRVRLWRTFAANGAAGVRGVKLFSFWLHFVPMPVQVGAATSPQAMLAPLQVRWESA